MARDEKVVFRTANEAAESSASWTAKRMRHPLFMWLGFRPMFAQHTRAENEALERWARERRRIVEIGVAEGASAFSLRSVMSSDGTLHLIDPFHLSRLGWINSQRRAARRAVGRSRNGEVVWIEKFSEEAARDWKGPIDFLFIDGDHDEKAVLQDWKTWHGSVVPGGCVAFHDARVFAGGWTTREYGPVRVVDSLFREEKPHGWEIVEETDSLVIVRRNA